MTFKNMRQALLNQHGEVPTHLGEGVNSFVVVFTNKKKGTYTVVVVGKKGLSCMVAVGKNWHYNPKPEDKLGGEV